METTHYAVRWVAQTPTAFGYRVRFVACASKGAAEFRRDQELRAGFPAKVLEVSAKEWRQILDGYRNTYKQTPGLEW